MSLKHYVTFYYPGILMNEEETRLISSRRDKIEIPKGSFGYRFFDRTETELDGETLKGKPKNHSGIHYLGKKMSLAEVKKELPAEKILISNMECNGYKHVVKTIRGNFQPLERRDKIICVG